MIIKATSAISASFSNGIFCIELNIQVSRITVTLVAVLMLMLNNPLCTEQKSYQCKIDRKKCKLKNLSIFFFTNKEHNFFIFFH